MTDTVQQQPRELPAGPLRRWILSHDESWLFIVPYIGLAVVLSIVISVFWLLAVVGVHFALEWMRQVYIARMANIRPGPLGLAARVAWELKLDIALIIFALVLALYMEVTLGLVGLSAAGRAGAMTGARAGAQFAVLQRVLRGILLSLDDLAQVARVVVMRRKNENGEQAEEKAGEQVPDGTPGWRRPWSRGDYITLGFGAICVILLLLTPVLTHHDISSMVITLAEELHPFPMGD